MLRAEKLMSDLGKIRSGTAYGDDCEQLAWLRVYDICGKKKVMVEFLRNSGISLDEVPALISWLQSLIEEVPE